MKIFSILTTIFLVVLVFTGCKKEKDWVEINSLHVETDTLFIKQKMKVWMSVESNNLQDVSYQWSCDSGKLTQPQGLSEMTWEAPVTPGKYIISCTVKIDGSSETREHEVYVAPYLFMDDASSIFNNAPVISNSAGTITRKVETVNGYSNGYYELNFKENASTNETRYVSYLFNNIKAPFSCAAKLGLLSNFSNDSFKLAANNVKRPNKVAYELTILRDPLRLDQKFIKGLRFEWFPQKTGGGTGAYGSKDPYDKVARVAHYGLFTFTYDSLNVSKTVKVFVPTTAADLLLEVGGARKNFTFSIGADFMVFLYVNGIKVLETSVIKDWRLLNNSKDSIYVLDWRYVFCNGISLDKLPKYFFDDAIIAVDGTILTGAK